MGLTDQFNCLGLVVFASLCAAPVFAAHELDNRDLGHGAELYQDFCASCHGADLQGEPDWRSPKADGTLPAPPHDETSHTWHHAPAQLFDYTALGGEAALAKMGVTNFKSGMPGFGDLLSEEEIWTILAFIQSTWPDRIKEMQAARTLPHD